MDADLLRGKRVVFTGRLASMTRVEAAKLVAAHGGQLSNAVSRRTSILVVGQEGWPLRKDGRLTQKLQTARLLQRQGRPITILTEEELFTRLGLEARSEGIRRLYTAPELAGLLDVKRDRLRSWIDAGLIRPEKTDHGVCWFDFRQVSGVKTLCDLAEAGVTKDRLVRSLAQLKAWMPDAEQPLAQLAILEQSGHLVVRLETGGLAEPTGQMLLDFEEPHADAVLSTTAPTTAAEWFELGCNHEDAGRLEDAAHAYRQALLAGGDSTICFNLANTLHAQGRKQEASERFYQCVELSPDNAEAWNNLGTVLAEIGRREESLAAFNKALELNPGYADARYNLADLLEEMGKKAEARRHWQTYIQHDSHSAWGRYARSRLS